ncbi:DUF5103 domain-containing protein [Flavobacterium psychrophilum]|uniref:type IX secretion system plug protein n=1 Tax=Flavobacterium psychrophilum TaxID=96345 RepID=UPI000B7C2EC9|nr:DUF5103 domain-containing protein [Flavobacterium psychrophilum]MEB3378558.1 DUF5103 domain-containing protein [Flavobacterium psychrophilum]SNA88100.1 conserved exported hypothetical protein [Flavobacterium psychrophilum]SNB09655.1 conserved exported hypothetical protein [Flavobacterium psychrophilum]
MAKRVFLLFISILLMNSVIGQTISETIPPFNIKTVTFTQNTNNVIPVFKLGEPFQLSFDDLFGTEEDYYYTIAQYNYNWTPTLLSKNEYLNGNDNQRIQDYENSFNTLQIYSHYRLNFPNNYTQITKSGNYLVSIFSSNKEIIFTKKIIIYEELVDVPMQVKRARNVTDNKYKHNLEFSIKSNSILFQNPVQNVKIILLQNGKWDNAIVNIKPQYTIGNDLIFKYDKETQFFAGNEYLYFDNKEIRVATNTIAKVNSNTGLYNSHLYTDSARKYKSYSYYPDINGNFKIRNLTAQNNDIEADYSWIYFTLFAINAPASTNIYITGMFNNNTISPENKMDYNTNKGVFEKAILIKQGFTNYNYTVLDSQNNISDKDPIDGNFHETENQYTAIVYYRQNGELYDRVIGKGNANSTNITN